MHEGRIMAWHANLAAAACLASAAMASEPVPISPAPSTIRTLALASAEPKKSPCSTGKFREFDFWVGTWEVTDGGSGRRAGMNDITLEQNRWVIIESWESASGA